VVFSPDGTRLVTVGGDHAPRVWDVASGREVLTLSGHTQAVFDVTFSPDGTRLITASIDQTVRVYALNIEDLMALVRRRITRALTFQECQKYLHVEEGCPLPATALQQVVDGNNLARAGEVDSAVTSFRKALALDPTLRLAPEAEARRFAAEALVEKGSLLARSKFTEALAAYTDAARLDPTLKISAMSWNDLCRFGSLRRHAGEVMVACERAMELQPDNGRFRDSRGVARAMTGDRKGALEDFQEVIKQVKDPAQKSQRQRWVDALRAGKDPFTDKEIQTLFDQSR
jgi:tetratricopeptide (TPR) repeat protein